MGDAVGIGILEIVCTVVYVMPRTSMLGAILLTGYLGGATATHVRIGDPFFFPIFEAAQRNNLTIATHHNTYAEGALGMGRYYVERHVLIPQVTMATRMRCGPSTCSP